MHGDPAEAYRDRLAARRATHERLTQIDQQFSYARLGVFGLGVLLALASWQQVLSAWLLVLPVAAFIVLVRRHERVIRQLDEAARAITFGGTCAEPVTANTEAIPVRAAAATVFLMIVVDVQVSRKPGRILRPSLQDSFRV